MAKTGKNRSKTSRASSKSKARQGKRWIRRLLWGVGVLAVGYGAVQLLGMLYGDAPGYAVPIQGRGHTPECTIGGYNSRPPTSGCHSPGQAAYGIHEEPVPHELQLHNLEHGAVVVQYRTSGALGADEGLIFDLTDLVERLRKEDVKYCRLILAPYPYSFLLSEGVRERAGLSADEVAEKRIALTAWGWIELLDEFDEGRIRAFIDAHINRGPERANDCP